MCHEQRLWRIPQHVCLDRVLDVPLHLERIRQAAAEATKERTAKKEEFDKFFGRGTRSSAPEDLPGALSPHGQRCVSVRFVQIRTNMLQRYKV